MTESPTEGGAFLKGELVMKTRAKQGNNGKVKIVKKVVVKQVVGKAQYMILKRKVRPLDTSVSERFMTLAQWNIPNLRLATVLVKRWTLQDKEWGVEYEYRIYKCERVHY